ncbi:hypothetical protein [Pedobacter sp. SYSU D00535]|uniref:hypothetical protein n=1 Tax=Pedobacter sp. SYSU D00535 TaxID=2810308 RepID=UPI001A96F276|nr:hypothetical protein [Pedobacter sp. SYSU D00535]
MKKLLIGFIAVATLAACSTIQSIIRSTLPYTATLIIPASTNTGRTHSAVSQASSVDQLFGNRTNANIKEVRISSARLEASNPNNQNLGVFSSIRLYLAKSDGSGELLVASRGDIGTSVGSSVVLDIDNSKFLDEIVRSNSARVRMEYVLREQLPVDVSVRATLNFTSTPATAQ